MSGFLADSSSFSTLYRAHARDVLVFFTRRTFDASAALDLTAETFAQAFGSRRTFRGHSDEEAGAWLFAIARRQLAGYFQDGAAASEMRGRLSVEVPAMTDGDLERIEELAGLSDMRGLLREQLSSLEQGQRDALWLRVVDEQPYAQVAARLGISEQAARTRVSRALRSIAESLTHTTTEPGKARP